MSYYYKVEEVKDAIGQHWLAVLAHLAPELEAALSRVGRHVHCPVHGGKNGDAFRLFGKNVHTTGGGICNTCGPRSNGFELLMWLKGWDFKTTLTAIGDFVQAPRHQTAQGKRASLQSEKSARDNATTVDSPQRQPRGRGRVVEFGSAPYRFNSKNARSYFVKLESKKGRQFTTWGVDLERAISQAGIEKGDHVSVFSLGRQAVTVTEPVVDAHGEVLEEKSKQVHRNVFEIVCDDKPATAGKPGARQSDDGGFETMANRSSTPAWARQAKGWATDATRSVIEQARRSAVSSAYASKRINDLWQQCLPLTSPKAGAVHGYFKHRGFVATLDRVARHDEVRFHPALEYFEQTKDGKHECIGKFPALVAAIRDLDGNLLNLHRTYLSPSGGKAKVPAAKKMMSTPDDVQLGGSAIQLGEPKDGVLGIAEGMETALAVYRATGVCTWSTINATLMSSFVPPKDVHTVVVWADLDRSATGERVAMAVKTRLAKEGVRVLIAMPRCSLKNQAKSVDWNDVLIEQGRFGFPERVKLYKFLGLDDAA